MKVCVIFRGDNVRDGINNNNRKYIDILICWENIKKTIYDDLIKNGDSCDIAFITYNSEKINEIKEIIKPTYLEIHNKLRQNDNFGSVISFIDKVHHNYDRFVILRCDIIYRYYITQWPKWKEKGIFLINKDVHWPREKLYSDILFLFDSEYFNQFKEAYYSTVYSNNIHVLGTYLYNNNIDFHLLYDTYHHMVNHPFFVLASVEDINIDLSNPLIPEPLHDVSQWNL
jgi:hypothetical protein